MKNFGNKKIENRKILKFLKKIVDFRDLRNFGDLEPGRRALDRSEAGRQAPGEDFDRFSMDFLQPRQRNHPKSLAEDENLLILLNFHEFP